MFGFDAAAEVGPDLRGPYSPRCIEVVAGERISLRLSCLRFRRTGRKLLRRFQRQEEE